MRQLHLILALALVTGFGVATAAVADVATVEASGACNYDGDRAGGETTVTVGDDGSPAAETPDRATFEAALENCIAAASDGTTPGPGSHLALSASALDGVGTADARTAPATDLATDGGDVGNEAAVEGACNPRDGGASDAAGAAVGTGDQEVSAPDPANVQAALAACATSGEPPQAGSFLAGSASLANGAVAVGFSTVPASTPG